MFSKHKDSQPDSQGPLLTVPTERESENLGTRLYTSKIQTAEINFDSKKKLKIKVPVACQFYLTSELCLFLYCF